MEAACQAYLLNKASLYLLTYREPNHSPDVHYDYHNNYWVPIDREGLAGSPLLWLPVFLAYPRAVVPKMPKMLQKNWALGGLG